MISLFGGGALEGSMVLGDSQVARIITISILFGFRHKQITQLLPALCKGMGMMIQKQLGIVG